MRPDGDLDALPGRRAKGHQRQVRRAMTDQARRDEDVHLRSTADKLARSELLPGVGPAAFLAIFDEVTEVHLAPGDQLVGHGEIADHLFVVDDGQLEVILATAHGTQQLALLQAGVVIGEIGLLAGDRRSATVRAVTACDLIAISPEGVRRLLAANPHHAEDLARRAMQRLRRSQLIEHFTRLLGTVDPDVLESIEQLLEWVTVPAGSLLFAEGDAGDAAYLVATGRLRAFRRSNGGAESVVGEIGPAELVGEMALIDGGTRGASVYAVRDCQLLRFSRAAYDQLLDRHPRVGLEIAQLALRRTRSSTGHRDPAPRLSFVLVPASPGVDVDVFATRLVAALGPDALCVSSATLDREMGREGMSQIDDEDVGAFRLAYRLEELEQRYRYLVLRVDDTWSPWSHRALRWADHVVLVADAGADPRPGPHEQELWSIVTRQHHPTISLALLHPAHTELPTGTRAWVDERTLTSHHHLRVGDGADVARLARLLTGTGTSLVLGGGGARGFAHLGVLDVLEELDTPIDMIGGTSIGSIMALGPAMGWTAARHRTTTVDAFQKLFDYTLPTTSLLRGRRITDKLERAIGDVDITDLWLPYFCVSANLTHARAEIHDRGAIVPAIRASIAIPGVLPPVPLDGDLLVDGGVVDNVPVEEMRRRNPTGRIVAVDVAPVDGPVAGSDYGLSVSGFAALRRPKRAGRPPNLISTMVRSSLIASVRDRERVVREGIADLYLDVSVDGGTSLDFSTAEHIADSGAIAARPALTRFLGAEDAAARAAAGGYVQTAPTRRVIIDPALRKRRGGVVLLTRRDLRHRGGRFAAVVLGVSVVLTLLFLMTGLTEQFHREPRDTVAALGADAWLVRAGASGAFTSGATMPADAALLVEGAGAAPVVISRHSITGAAEPIDVVILGHRRDQLGAPSLVDGRRPEAAGEIVIDASSGLDLGETAQIGERRYVVTGLADRTTLFAGMPMVFMDIRAAQDLLYRGQELASAILLDGAPDEVPDGFATLTPDEIAADATRPLERSIASVDLIRILLWFVAAMIIGTMTYLSALERRRDVAVLKAVGASTVALGLSIALQGVLIALAAAAIASVLQVVVVPVFPLEVSVPARAFLQVPAIAVLVSLLAGAFGLRKAVGTDPALAFAGQGS